MLVKYIVLTSSIPGVPYADKGTIHELIHEFNGAVTFNVRGISCRTYMCIVCNTLGKAYIESERIKDASKI